MKIGMKVYVLLKVYDREGAEVIDVFTSKVAATDEAESLAKDDTYAFYEIEERVLR